MCGIKLGLKCELQCHPLADGCIQLCNLSFGSCHKAVVVGVVMLCTVVVYQMTFL